MSAALRHLGMVVEGPDDARTVPGLAERIFLHEVPDSGGDLEQVRAFRGLSPGTPFLAWSAVDHEAEKRGVPRRHGHFGREPAIEDARRAVLALRCFVAQDPLPAAVLLVRDSDGKREERVQGLEQARQDGAWPFPVLIGIAHTMRECWVLAGFIPQSPRERDALAALRKELGFDPTARSEQLDASKDTAKKSPKRVLLRLTRGDGEREAQCWTDTPLERLHRRGAENGLSAFLDEVKERLVPVLAAPPDGIDPPR